MVWKEICFWVSRFDIHEVREKCNVGEFSRLIIRHMAHVVHTPSHELPCGELLTRIFKRENWIWWLDTGENRRRDEEEDFLEVSEEEEEGSDSEETEEDVNPEESTPDVSEKEHYDSETKDEAAKKSSESVEVFYDAVDEDIVTTGGPTQSAEKKISGKSSKVRRVDPSSAEPDYELIRVQVQLDQAMKANSRLQELLKHH
ncbi:hypothetical protein Dimus_003400 [Dionaea muscipula]